MSKITLKYYLRKDRRKSDGTCQINLRFTKNRKPRKIGMGLWIHEDDWLDTNGRYVNNNSKKYNAKDWNYYLRHQMEKATRIVMDAEMNEQDLTFESFKEFFLTESKNNSIDFFEIYESITQSKIKQNISSETLKNYTKEYNRFKLYSNKIDVKDINQEWLDNLQLFFRDQIGNGNNTIRRTLRHVHLVIKKCIQNDLIVKDPFVGYKLPKFNPRKREFLEEDELEKFEKLYWEEQLSDSHKNILRQFLNACYMGLDFSCTCDFDTKDIRRENGLYVVNRQRVKNGNEYIVPVSDKAAKLLDLELLLKKGGRVFRTISNQKTNDYLRAMTKRLGIKNKKVTFHCGRHTFGTITVNKGIPLEAIRKYMGHSSIKQTEYYSRISKKLALQHFDKLNS